MARRKRKRPHGTGSIRVRDGRAQVQWTRPDGSRGTKTVALEDARTFLARASGGQEPAAAGALAKIAQTWLDGRAGMASNYDDRNRWKNHLLPALGTLEPDQVTVPVVKQLILDLGAKGLSRGTVRLCMALLSSLYGDLVEDGVARLNPVKMLSRKTRRNFLTPETDWKKIPFLRDSADIRRIYEALRVRNPDIARAYIVGALAGLRTGEARALRWEHVDLGARLIHVRDKVGRRSGAVETPKDDESRYVPISDSLYWYLRQDMPPGGGGGLVCSAAGRFLSDHKMGRLISEVLATLELPKMRWYEATRHTFASQWVINGGTLETLREMMGHSSVTVTERYAHLIPGRYTSADRARVVVDAPAEKFVN